MLEAPARGWTHPLVLACLTAGAVLSLLFVIVELRRRHPLLDVRLFGDPTFATGAAAITVFFLAMFGFFFLSMQYIQLVMGYDAIRTALALSPLTGPMLVLSVLSFWYVPAAGGLRLVVLVGLLLVAAGFLAMRTLEIGSPVLASRLAAVDPELGDRTVHGPHHVGDHDVGARRQTGSPRRSTTPPGRSARHWASL